MKNKILLICVIGVLVVSGVYFYKKRIGTGVVDPNFNVALVSPPGNKPLTPKLISMRSSGFEPPNLTIQKGTSVTFRNDEVVDRWPAAADHPNHSSYPEFDPKKAVKSSDVWVFVFDKVGSWSFHDHLNPSYEGTVTVVEQLEEGEVDHNAH